MKRFLSLLLALMLGMFSYQVSAQQNDGNMMRSHGSVTTDPSVTTNDVTNLSLTSATLNATITNPDDVNITDMGFEWRKIMGGFNTVATGTGSGNTFSATLNDLTPDAGYVYKAFITFDGTTKYGEEVYFTTTDVGVQDYLEQKLTLYPNPVTDMVSVTTDDANIQITGVEIYNAYGQLVNTVAFTENPLCINVSGMADGMYFVRVKTDSGVVTKSFVKK
ncbi:MAG: T9SS type A sorting domain-containing protein [Bacteroidales bacterium]|nr:T9SS type A sorting domain-containing protein [Bacteroidales bacterium]